MPLTSFGDAFRTHRVIAAADKSAAERRAVKVSEIPAS
jgi:predicted dehydrogenase